MRAVVMHGAYDLRIDNREQVEIGIGEVRVGVAVGGICGSDLSYYRKGGVADFLIREPLTLGHEVAGEVIEMSGPAAGLAIGTRVAINPSRPCLVCRNCRAGRENLCLDMKFLGSAARTPHVQGAFSDNVVVRADQCVPIPDPMPFRLAACAEPLAVALHAVQRARLVLGRHVLVAGAGPIGLLCAACAVHAGAASVTVTDLAEPPLRIARAMGATETIDLTTEPDRLSNAAAQRDGFDVAFEVTGAPASLAAMPPLVQRGGSIVQVGMFPPGTVSIGVNMLMTREIDLIGSFRFDAEFPMAVAILAAGSIDISPMLSAIFQMGDARAAFDFAADRRKSVKVHLAM